MGEEENSFWEMIKTGKMSEEFESALTCITNVLNPKAELDRINFIHGLCLANPEAHKDVIKFLEDATDIIKEAGKELGLVSVDKFRIGWEVETEIFFVYLKFKILDDTFSARVRVYDEPDELERLADIELGMLESMNKMLEENAKIGEQFIFGRKKPRKDMLSRAAEISFIELRKRGLSNPTAQDVAGNIPIGGNIHEIDEYGAIWWKNSRGIEKKTEFKSFQNRLCRIRKKYNNIQSQSIDICH